MKIDRYKLKITTFTTELDKPLNPDLRTLIQTEIETYEVSHRDNADGTYDEIYRAKVVGATECKQGEKIVKGKSKRSQSQKWRNVVFRRNPDEEYYERIMNKMLAHSDQVIDFIESI